jgi:hypothetical protein
VRAAAREGEGYSHQNDALILGGPLHVVVCIVSKLEYVWWEGLLLIGYTAMTLGYPESLQCRGELVGGQGGKRHASENGD